MHHDLKSWRKVGRVLGIPARTAWRYANDPDYEPKRKDIRQALGLDQDSQVTYVRQVRTPAGTFVANKQLEQDQENEP